MNYTVTSMKDFGGNQELTLDKSGNKYVVGLTNLNNKLYFHKYFNTIEEAYDSFNKVVKCFVFGTHSYEDRCDMI